MIIYKRGRGFELGTSDSLRSRLDFREQIQLSVGAGLELACAWKHLRLEIEPRTITAQEINKELVLCISLNSETAKSKSPNRTKVTTSTFHDATTGESPTK